MISIKRKSQVIHFFYERISFRLKNIQKIRWWIESVVIFHNYTIDQLNYIFCNDQYLHKMNFQYLQHDTYTDILTFDNSEKKNIINGDIFISIERLRENKYIFNTSFENELYRVMIHGILHLIGFNDKTEKQKVWMRSYEQKQIKTMKKMLSN